MRDDGIGDDAYLGWGFILSTAYAELGPGSKLIVFVLLCVFWRTFFFEEFIFEGDFFEDHAGI